MLPLKDFVTVNDQIKILRSRGMMISDEAFARQWLCSVNYYRLSGYWYIVRQNNPNGGKSDSFYAGARFEDVAALYEADRKLRTLIHDGLERVEISMRTRLVAEFCSIDVEWHMDRGMFREEFDYYSWVSTVGSRVRRSNSHNDAIKHYRDNYGNRFPFWVLAEVLDFGDISRLFGGVDAGIQRRIAESYGLLVDTTRLTSPQRSNFYKNHPLAIWLQQLTIIRNVCAHHARLWNKSFIPASTIALRTNNCFANLPQSQSEKIFGALVVMSKILREVSPGTSWPEKVANTLKNEFVANPIVRRTSMGIPSNWNYCF